MTKQTEQMIGKLINYAFASLLAVTGWLVKSDITSMAESLKDIRTDVSELNTKALLQEQSIKYQFEDVNGQMRIFKKQISALEAKE